MRREGRRESKVSRMAPAVHGELNNSSRWRTEYTDMKQSSSTKKLHEIKISSRKNRRLIIIIKSKILITLVSRPVVGIFLEFLGIFRDFSASVFHTKSHSFLIVTHINWYSLESEFHDLSDATLITKNRQILEALYPFKIRVFKILSNSSKFRFF